MYFDRKTVSSSNTLKGYAYTLIPILHAALFYMFALSFHSAFSLPVEYIPAGPDLRHLYKYTDDCT